MQMVRIIVIRESSVLQNTQKSAEISKNVWFKSSLVRPLETSWRSTASRHRNNARLLTNDRRLDTFV